MASGRSDDSWGGSSASAADDTAAAHSHDKARSGSGWGASRFTGPLGRVHSRDGAVVQRLRCHAIRESPATRMIMRINFTWYDTKALPWRSTRQSLGSGCWMIAKDPCDDGYRCSSKHDHLEHQIAGRIG